MPTAKDVAKWMAAQLKQRGELAQEDAAAEVEEQFGDEFTYINDNGNTSIDREVLKEFRKLTPQVVWDRVERMWRYRDTFDEPGRRQAD